MRQLIVAAALVAALASLGARTSRSVPTLTAPEQVEQGSSFPVKGAGFEEGIPVNVCMGSDCRTSDAGPGGEFVQIWMTPSEALGAQLVTAIQPLNEKQKGRSLKTEIVVNIVEGK